MIVLTFFFAPRFDEYIKLAFEHPAKGNIESNQPPDEEISIVVSLLKAVISYRFPRIVSIGNLLKALAMLFIVAFLSAAILATLASRPPLPKLDLVSNHDTKVKGSLLSHAEGFWYVLNPNGKILAIPDKELQKAQAFSYSLSGRQ